MLVSEAPNVRAKATVEADADWPRKDNLPQGLERPGGGCRSGSPLERGVRPQHAALAGRVRNCNRRSMSKSSVAYQTLGYAKMLGKRVSLVLHGALVDGEPLSTAGPYVIL